MTPVELRRQRAEKLGQARGVYDKIRGEARDPTPEETQAVEALIGEADALETKAVAAEQWGLIDRQLAEMGQSTGKVSGPLPHEDPRNTGTKHQYSMLTALRQAAGIGEPGGIPTLYGLEREVNDEMRKRRMAMGLPSPRGILIPNNLPVDIHAAIRFARESGVLQGSWTEKYDLDTAAGAGSIPTILDRNMIDILRARMVTVNMGAQVMDNMQGLFAIPRQNQTATFYWVTQGQSVTKSNPTIDQVPFSPHTGGAQTVYTRQLLEQTNQPAEQFVRGDQAAVIARGIESAGLNGTGSGGSPLGAMQNPLITTIAGGTNGAAPTWIIVVQLESAVAILNADMGNLGYITDAAMRGTMKTTAKIGSTYPVFLWDTSGSDTPLNGYRAGVTNLLPANIGKGSGTNLHALLYGNWNDMIYAFWSGLDTIVDPFTQAGSGSVVITTLQDCDVNFRHPESFSRCVDLISNQ